MSGIEIRTLGVRNTFVQKGYERSLMKSVFFQERDAIQHSGYNANQIVIWTELKFVIIFDLWLEIGTVFPLYGMNSTRRWIIREDLLEMERSRLF